MTVSDLCAADQPNQSFARRRRSALLVHRTDCLACKAGFNFDLAEKKSDAAEYQISEVSTMIRKTKKYKLHETLKKVVAERTDPLPVELAAKLSNVSCICAEGAKYISTVCNDFWVLSRLFTVESTINTLLVPKMMDLTT